MFDNIEPLMLMVIESAALEAIRSGDSIAIRTNLVTHVCCLEYCTIPESWGFLPYEIPGGMTRNFLNPEAKLYRLPPNCS